MARVRAILCVALAACYSPGYVDCEVTCASGLCPADLSCVAGLCRVAGNTGACVAPGDDAGPTDGIGVDLPTGGDEDADGVGNEADNCGLVSNPDQANEDSDALGDVCDPCPISANNDDDDGDGVGNACEPIAAGMDKLIRFEGFHNAAIPAGFSSTGTWSFPGGTARVTSSANTASSLTMMLPTAGTIRTTVVAKVRIDAPLISTADATGAGVVSRSDGTNAGIMCGAGRDPGTSTDHLMILKVAAAADANLQSVAGTAAINTTQVISLTRNPGNEVFACSTPGTTIAQIPPSPVPAGMRAGIRTRSMNATFEWVMIFETQ